LIAPRSKRKDRGAISDYEFTASPREESGPAEESARWSTKFKFTSLASFAFLTRSVRATKKYSL
jgi:hypothetical protein